MHNRQVPIFQGVILVQRPCVVSFQDERTTTVEGIVLNGLLTHSLQEAPVTMVFRSCTDWNRRGNVSCDLLAAPSPVREPWSGRDPKT